MDAFLGLRTSGTENTSNIGIPGNRQSVRHVPTAARALDVTMGANDVGFRDADADTRTGGGFAETDSPVRSRSGARGRSAIRQTVSIRPRTGRHLLPRLRRDDP